MGLFSGTVTTSMRHVGHSISLAVTGAMMIIMISFMVYTLKNRRHLKSPWQRNGPLILVCIATPLILADLCRHVLNDANVVDWSEYRNDNGPENITNLSAYGWFFTIFCTYSGFICMFIGVFWNANFLQKMKVIGQRWRELRAMHAARSSA